VTLTRLQLRDFRNYESLNLQLQDGPTILYGPNGAGKTNVLEAVALLATTRSFRARADRDMVRLDAPSHIEGFRHAFAQADVAVHGHPLRLELFIEAGEVSAPSAGRKRYRVDGVPRRAADVVGRLKAVLFQPDDVGLAVGPPADRRRFLDVAISQTDRTYARLLQTFVRTVQQRNALLGTPGIRASITELEAWDIEFTQAATEILRRRLAALGSLSETAARYHEVLSGGAGRLSVTYRASSGTLEPHTPLEDYLRQGLERTLARSLDRRMTLIGPHRDDLELLLDGEPLAAIGSRGQQRTVALSLRMAEAEFIYSSTGDMPILLLDEPLSELDDRRRTELLAFAESYPQVLITGTSLTGYPEQFLADARLVQVESGRATQPRGGAEIL
jgi:DNA replication and repair protein RecF